MTESALSDRVRLLAPRLGARLFRNQVGLYKLADGRTLRSGLGVGSPDLVGWRVIEITPEMVGQHVAVFTGLELKVGRRQPTVEQQAWLAAIREAGGIAGVVRSEEEARAVLEHVRSAKR